MEWEGEDGEAAEWAACRAAVRSLCVAGTRQLAQCDDGDGLGGQHRRTAARRPLALSWSCCALPGSSLRLRWQQWCVRTRLQPRQLQDSSTSRLSARCRRRLHRRHPAPRPLLLPQPRPHARSQLAQPRPHARSQLAQPDLRRLRPQRVAPPWRRSLACLAVGGRTCWAWPWRPQLPWPTSSGSSPTWSCTPLVATRTS